MFMNIFQWKISLLVMANVYTVACSRSGKDSLMLKASVKFTLILASQCTPVALDFHRILKQMRLSL